MATFVAAVGSQKKIIGGFSKNSGGAIFLHPCCRKRGKLAVRGVPLCTISLGIKVNMMRFAAVDETNREPNSGS